MSEDYIYDLPLYPKAYTIVSRIGKRSKRELGLSKSYDQELSSSFVKADTLMKEVEDELSEHFVKKKTHTSNSIAFNVNVVGKDTEKSKEFYLEEKKDGSES